MPRLHVHGSSTRDKLSCMQEVAGNHGVAMWGRSDMGFATDPIMVEHNLIFVVTRMQMRMDAYPQWCALD